MNNSRNLFDTKTKNISLFQLPSLKNSVLRDNSYSQKNTIEYIYQNIIKKNNQIKLNYPSLKFNKPFSGNQLKCSNNNIIKESDYFITKYLVNKVIEREISTANSYFDINNNNYLVDKKKNLNEHSSINPNNIKYLKILRNKSINNFTINNNKPFLPKKSNDNITKKSKHIKAKFKLKSLQETKKFSTKYLLFNNKCFINYSFNEYPNLEHRKQMEDFLSIKINFSENLQCNYFAIFDGHGGKEVSLYLKDNLHKILSNEINNTKNNLKIAIKNSFENIDNIINNSLNFKNEVGSTGTILLLYKDINSPTKKSLICANVGDSKAFLINKKQIKLITKDHKCSDKEEVKRIKNNGGIVFRERVFGTLILTRSFGDKEMKKFGVIPTPYIFLKKIEKEDIFVIMGSDGIWDVVEEDEIYKMSMDENITSDELSKKIIDLAKERETHDNISCIVIKLNEK